MYNIHITSLKLVYKYTFEQQSTPIIYISKYDSVLSTDY